MGYVDATLKIKLETLSKLLLIAITRKIPAMLDLDSYISDIKNADLLGCCR